jgi:tetratricopeptide (TPR) repeat protein
LLEGQALDPISMTSFSQVNGRLDAESSAAVLAELERVLASDVFRGAPQLSSFLSFIVERSVEGRSSELKGYTVAVEALGRTPDFDPQTDPIVRVEAGRLRKALSQYYLGDGAPNPLRISIPVGGYVPSFEPSHDEPAAEEMPETGEASQAPASPAARRFNTRWLMLLLAGLGCLVFAAVWLRDPSVLSSQPAAGEHMSLEDMDALQGTAQLPSLAVTILELPQSPVSSEVARRVTGLLVDALTRFDDVVTVKTIDPTQSAAPDVDYLLELSAVRFGELNETSARLRSVKDNRVVWSTSASRPPSSGANDPEWLDVARGLAIRLAEPYGVIHADFRQRANNQPMRCIYEALDNRRMPKLEDQLAARICLERVIEQAPQFHPAWSHLAIILVQDYNAGVGDRTTLDRALSVALQAVRLAPSSARAQQALMGVLFARGQTEEALAAGREALSLNPYDPDAMGGLGSRLVLLNRPLDGLPFLQRAISLSVGRPPGFDFFAFLAARLIGDDKLAAGYAAKLLPEDGAYGLLGRALYYSSLGDKTGLAAVISSFDGTAPQFRANPRDFLERRGFSPDLVKRVLSDLGPDFSAAAQRK